MTWRTWVDYGEFAVHAGESAADPHESVFQGDVVPGEGDGLATPKAGVDEELEEQSVAGVACGPSSCPIWCGSKNLASEAVACGRRTVAKGLRAISLSRAASSAIARATVHTCRTVESDRPFARN